MPIDEKGRKKRARKAGKASGKARHNREMTARDKNIVLAHDLLTNAPQSKSDKLKAYEFLCKNTGNRPNLQPSETSLRKLADATGLTRARVWQIVKNYQKPTKSGKNPI